MDDHGIKMRCGACGHEDLMERFCGTPVYGELPPGIFQCPACTVAVRRKQGRPEVYPNGFVMPGEVTLEKEESVL